MLSGSSRSRSPTAGNWISADTNRTKPRIPEASNSRLTILTRASSAIRRLYGSTRRGPNRMIHLLYGDDEFSISETVASMKDAVEPPDLRDVNVTVLDGPSIGFDELRATCDTVPFLAEKRVVVVHGLLGQFERRRGPALASAPEQAPRKQDA